MVNWKGILDTSIYNNPMDVDLHIDEWKDIFEKDLSIEGQMVS